MGRWRTGRRHNRKDEKHDNHVNCERELLGHVCMLAMEKNSTLSLLNYIQAGHGNDTTLWLLQAEIKVLLSGAGESKTSNKFPLSDSSLQ